MCVEGEWWDEEIVAWLLVPVVPWEVNVVELGMLALPSESAGVQCKDKATEFAWWLKSVIPVRRSSWRWR